MFILSVITLTRLAAADEIIVRTLMQLYRPLANRAATIIVHKTLPVASTAVIISPTGTSLYAA